jgi:hypothetical protein
MPAHHKLEAFLDEYLRAADVVGDAKGPLFRSAVRRAGTIAATAMHRVDAWRMIQRRAAELGMKVKIGCHTFWATGITAYLEARGTLENAQAIKTDCQSRSQDNHCWRLHNIRIHCKASIYCKTKRGIYGVKSRGGCRTRKSHCKFRSSGDFLDPSEFKGNG